MRIVGPSVILFHFSVVTRWPGLLRLAVWRPLAYIPRVRELQRRYVRVAPLSRHASHRSTFVERRRLSRPDCQRGRGFERLVHGQNHEWLPAACERCCTIQGFRERQTHQIDHVLVWMINEGRAAARECGMCEEKCPQHLPIREQLKEAHTALTNAQPNKWKPRRRTANDAVQRRRYA